MDVKDISRNATNFYYLICFTVFFLHTSYSSAETTIYTWKDSLGTTHYSFTPKNKFVDKKWYFKTPNLTPKLQKKLKDFYPENISNEEMLKRIQGNWDQIKINPELGSILRDYLKKFNTKIRQDISIIHYYVSLNIKNTEFIITSIPEDLSINKNIVSSEKIETNNNKVVELGNYWLFPEHTNPFLHNFSATILRPHLDSKNLKSVYKNNGRFSIDINKDILRITLYPKGQMHHNKIEIYYHKKSQTKQETTTDNIEQNHKNKGLE